MTTEQATEIREHLIIELNRNGFGDVVNEVNARLEEDYQEDNFERNPRSLLIFFLEESIDIINSLSNSKYKNLITRFNRFVESERPIEAISVELLNQGEPTLYDLSNLPDYSAMSEGLQGILSEIRNEN